MKQIPNNQKELYWRVIDEDDPSTFPHISDYILLSFINFNIPVIGRCEGDDDIGFTFYAGDDTTPLASEGMFVGAWMPLPEDADV